MSSAPRSWSQHAGPPDFEVRYRFFTPREGGRQSAPRQHLRFNFLYDGDDPTREGSWMIWPEMLDAAGDPLSEGPVPAQGLAHMFIADPDLRETVHRHRLTVGVRGFFVVGALRVAACEVTKLVGLAADATAP